MHYYIQLEARHGVERVNSHVHLHVPAACALNDAPEDGCIWHPKYVERGKCNKVTLNNLHQAGLNKPEIFRIRPDRPWDPHSLL